jgi:hypothetical protein
VNIAFQRCRRGIPLAAVIALILFALRVSAQCPSRNGRFDSNVGVGFRWNVNDNLFVKGLASSTATQLSDTTDEVYFIQGTLLVGWSF